MRSGTHPWFAQRRLEHRQRSRARRLLRTVWGVAIVVVPPVALAGEGGRAAADAGLRAFSQWPVAVAASLAVPMYVATGARLRPLAHELRHGWWAAAPVAPRAITRALLAVGATMAAMTLLSCAWALAVMLLAARAPASPHVAIVATLAGIGVGAALGIATALRRAPPPRVDGRRSPLLPLAALNDARLPHLFDWQHRAAVLHWRRGGHMAPIAAAMLLLPGGATAGGASGLLVLATALAWFGAALAGAAEAATQAGALLRALPLTPAQRRRAVLRYPAFAAACALAWSTLAAMLIGPGLTLSCVIGLLLLAVAERPARSLWRAAR